MQIGSKHKAGEQHQRRAEQYDQLDDLPARPARPVPPPGWRGGPGDGLPQTCLRQPSLL